MSKESYKKQWYKENRDRILKERRNKYWSNREEHSKKSREYRSKNRHLERNRRLINKYGICLEEFNKMYQLQDGKCATCRKSCPNNSRNGLYVDHNHSNGKIRALLCSNCNRVLGLINENKATLESMIKYLEYYNEKTSNT